MEIIRKKFSDLTRDEAYAIFQLRAEIFVVEHRCIYNDFDHKDQDSIHFYLKDKGKIIGYLRLILSPVIQCLTSFEAILSYLLVLPNMCNK